jgi:hypothetical protein
VLFLPQKPYMVLGSLRDQLLYPTWTRGRQESGDSSSSSSSSNGSRESSSSGGSNGNGEVTSSMDELRKATATPAKEVSGSGRVDCSGLCGIPSHVRTDTEQLDTAAAADVCNFSTLAADMFDPAARVVLSTLVRSQPQLLQTC